MEDIELIWRAEYAKQNKESSAFELEKIEVGVSEERKKELINWLKNKKIESKRE